MNDSRRPQAGRPFPQLEMTIPVSEKPWPDRGVALSRASYCVEDDTRDRRPATRNLMTAFFIPVPSVTSCRTTKETVSDRVAIRNRSRSWAADGASIKISSYLCRASAIRLAKRLLPRTRFGGRSFFSATMMSTPRPDRVVRCYRGHLTAYRMGDMRPRSHVELASESGVSQIGIDQQKLHAAHRKRSARLAITNVLPFPIGRRREGDHFCLALCQLQVGLKIRESAVEVRRGVTECPRLVLELSEGKAWMRPITFSPVFC